MKRVRTLQNKLNFCYAIVIAGVILSIAVCVSFASMRLLREKMAESCEKELSLAIEQTDGILDHIENISIHFVINQAYRQAYAATGDNVSSYEEYQQKINLTQALIEFFGPLHDVSSAGFWRGQTLTAYVDFTKLGEGYSQEELADKVNSFEAGTTSMQWNLFPGGTGRDASMQMVLFRKTYAFSGEFLGTLVLSLSEQSIREIYNRSFPTDSALLIESNETVQMVSSTFDKEKNGDILSILQGPEQLQEDYLVTRCHYQRLNSGFIMAVSKAEIEKDTRNLVAVILVIGGLGYFVAVSLFYRSTKTQLGPLSQIVEKVGLISQGDYTIRIPTEFNSELNDLAMQINHMAQNTGILMREMQKKEAQKKAYEVSYLQMQMRPHFLYNTLETLCGMVEVGEQSQVILMIQHISGFYREVLNGGKTIISIGSEVKIAEHYLQIMQKRYRESFSFRIDISEGLWDCAIPKLTLQPILENSIIHGFVVPGKSGQILLIGLERREEICIKIIDNGVGISDTRLGEIRSMKESKKASFGMASIQERLQLYFGGTACVRVQSSPKEGTTVSVCFPKKKMLNSDYDEDWL